MTEDERERIIFAAGEITGILLRWPAAVWRAAAERSPGLRPEYRQTMERLARLQEEIRAGVPPASINPSPPES